MINTGVPKSLLIAVTEHPPTLRSVPSMTVVGGNSDRSTTRNPSANTLQRKLLLNALPYLTADSNRTYVVAGRPPSWPNVSVSSEFAEVAEQRVPDPGDLDRELQPDHGPVRPDRLPVDRDPAAGRLDDVGPDVSEHGHQGVFGALATARGGDVDPGSRLAVELAAAHRPVEEVLEAAWQRSRVLRGAEQHRIRLCDLPAQLRGGRRQQVAVMIGVERRQLGQAVIQDRRSLAGGDSRRRRQRGGVGRAAPGAPRHQQDPCLSAHNAPPPADAVSLNLAVRPIHPGAGRPQWYER